MYTTSMLWFRSSFQLPGVVMHPYPPFAPSLETLSGLSVANPSFTASAASNSNHAQGHAQSKVTKRRNEPKSRRCKKPKASEKVRFAELADVVQEACERHHVAFESKTIIQPIQDTIDRRSFLEPSQAGLHGRDSALHVDSDSHCDELDSSYRK